ncbi:MAG: hypothetical protein ACR2NB_14680 [Solirubrobacteraceae bacterium]
MEERAENVPHEGEYPAFIEGDPEREHRWDLCVVLAARNLDVPLVSADARSAAGVLYNSDIPTAV